MVAACLTRVIAKVHDGYAQRQFAEATRELLESVRDVRDAIPGRQLEIVGGREAGTLKTPFVVAQGIV